MIPDYTEEDTFKSLTRTPFTQVDNAVRNLRARMIDDPYVTEASVDTALQRHGWTRYDYNVEVFRRLEKAGVVNHD